MKALAIVERRRAEIIDLPRPEPGPGEVCVAISHVGLCGTDLHVFDGAFGIFPMIPGHDAVGAVSMVGYGVQESLVGSMVALDPSACCTRAALPTAPCPACRRGATNLCASQSYMGISAPGACAEYVLIPAARAIAVPSSVGALQATCLEPLAVALHLKERITDTQGAVVIFGAGPIGLAIALVLGRDRAITLVEPSEGRRAFARGEGCRSVLDPNELPNPLPAILIDASGHQSVARIIESRAESSSLIVMVGGPMELSGRTILTRELEIRAVKGGRGLYPESLDLIRHGLDTSRWTTAVVKLEQAPAFFSEWLRSTERPFRTALQVASDASA